MRDIRLRLRHLRLHARTAEYGDLERQADLPVVALKLTEVVFVVIVFGEEAILRHQIDARQSRRVLAALLQSLGSDLRLQFAQFLVGLQRRLHGILLRFRQRGGGPLLCYGTHAVVRREAGRDGQGSLRIGLISFERVGQLPRLRQLQRRLLFGERQGATLPHLRLNCREDRLQAVRIFAGKGHYTAARSASR